MTNFMDFRRIMSSLFNGAFNCHNIVLFVVLFLDRDKQQNPVGLGALQKAMNLCKMTVAS